MRLAILWEQWTGYLDVSVRALCEQYPVDIMRAHVRPVSDAPFKLESFVASQCVYTFNGHPIEDELVEIVDRFRPDAILICSWHRSVYRKIARSYAGRAIRIVGMDNQWRGTLKQWGGRLIAPYFIKPMFDKALVAGPRQRRFARILGFSDTAIFEPLYCCDVDSFAQENSVVPFPDKRNFLFVGRLATEKGISLLVDAYRAYRMQSKSRPWGLIVAGTGPLLNMVTDVEGIEHCGFIQPSDLPALFARASCFVLPSHFEPWGVVIHEAVSAGLPVICTSACGAADVFVSPGGNGFVVAVDDLPGLTDRMIAIAGLSTNDLEQFRQCSRLKSRAITPHLWADTLWAMMRDATDERAMV